MEKVTYHNLSFIKGSAGTNSLVFRAMVETMNTNEVYQASLFLSKSPTKPQSAPNVKLPDVPVYEAKECNVAEIRQTHKDVASYVILVSLDESNLTLYAPKITEHVKLKTRASRIASRVEVIEDVGREEVIVDAGREEIEEVRESVERDAWVGIEVAIDVEEYDSDVGWQEEIDGIKNEKRRVITDNLEDFKTLYKGQTFPDLKVAKQYINFFALANGYGLRVQKSDTGRKVKVMRKDLSSGLQLNVQYEKMKRAKRTILTQLEGSFKDDYNKIIAYAQELRESNPRTNVVVNISRDALRDGRKRFLTMYTCFHALKMGWKQDLRPFIGMDRTFLKGEARGQLLVAIGQDSMRQFYPIAWAVIDKETKSTWTWFVQCLKSSLDLKDGEGFTFISDMQKIITILL
ncbi:hypothetical protein Cni_G17199 [Canna indica]|uniref:MULE transposase domain-containing protein n=1 Tax=Canna indica TaxID=4628 RepID=A0AAQ3QGC8_9LILI|nr:hypothetical protein Cni_G17199 [Canna indica]